MAIPVEHEDTEALKQWGLGLSRTQEHCVFCNKESRYWYIDANACVCQDCAPKHEISEIKDAKNAARERYQLLNRE